MSAAKCGTTIVAVLRPLMLLDIESGSGEDLSAHRVEADACHWQAHANLERLLCRDCGCRERCNDCHRQSAEKASTHSGQLPLHDECVHSAPAFARQD